jgi:hypothetical protein
MDEQAETQTSSDAGVVIEAEAPAKEDPLEELLKACELAFKMNDRGEKRGEDWHVAAFNELKQVVAEIRREVKDACEETGRGLGSEALPEDEAPGVGDQEAPVEG